MDAIFRFAEHVALSCDRDLPTEAIAASKRLLLDTLGVGVGGSAAPWAAELIAAQGSAGGDARVWVHGTRLPAPAAALCNAWQIHNSEFDCVHEAAVVHVMAAMLAAVMAHAERVGAVSGRDLLTAITLGADVGAGLGLASRAPMRFFRPATAGAFAATAAVGKLMDFDVPTLANAFAATLAQLCGTMQAHTEGSPLLAMQVGFNARNAVFACDLAAAGVPGPQAVLEGRFGYYALFEGTYDLAAVLAGLGKIWRVTEVAHKPFPSGRATHGMIDGALRLRHRHGLDAGAVAAVECRVPALTHRLVGRPSRPGMVVGEARLCAPYVLACALLNGTVGIDDFTSAALADADRLALASKVTLAVDDNPDPNALAPVHLAITLDDGTPHEIRIDQIYGSPTNPMSAHAQRAKFRRNWMSGAMPLSEAAGDALMARVDALESVVNVAEMVDLMMPQVDQP